MQDFGLRVRLDDSKPCLLHPHHLQPSHLALAPMLWFVLVISSSSIGGWGPGIWSGCAFLKKMGSPGPMSLCRGLKAHNVRKCTLRI